MFRVHTTYEGEIAYDITVATSEDVEQVLDLLDHSVYSEDLEVTIEEV